MSTPVDFVNRWRGCQHRELYFGSGGFYVFCAECGAPWTATDHDAEFDHQRAHNIVNGNDRRVKT